MDKHFVYKPEDFEFIEGAPEAIRLLNNMGYLVIVVSNQSGIARGYYDYDDVLLLHEYIDEQLSKYGAKINGYYICPHHPDFGEECECRKPKTGLIENAVRDFDIDIFSSYMAGDKESDVLCAANAGLTPIQIQPRTASEPFFDNMNIRSACSILDFVNSLER